MRPTGLYNQSGRNVPGVGIEGGGLLNLGPKQVMGLNYLTNAIGFNYEFNQHVIFGVAYEYQLTSRTMLMNNMINCATHSSAIESTGVRANPDKSSQERRGILWPGSYQGNTLWWLGSAADGHHAQRRYTIHETQTTDRTDGTDKEDHRTILFQVHLASWNQFRPQSPTSLIRVFGVIRGYFLANLAHQAKERRSDTLLPATSQN